MANPDRYTIRRVVNDLIDMLIDEGVDAEDITARIDDPDELSDSDIDYFDISWLYSKAAGR